MENKLEVVAKSYDRHFIEYGKDDVPAYDNLPDYITTDPDYLSYHAELESGGNSSGNEGSGCKKIKDYLLPNQGMNFIDLGCCLNLMLRGYDKWPSMYHGVDISEKTIELLNHFITEQNLSVGGVYRGSIHETPFDDNQFDIGCCIGVLEYFEKDFVEKAIREAHRIIKPGGRLVLDIPNINSATGRIMMLIEEYIGRTCDFNLSQHEFEAILQNYFEIDETSQAVNDAENMGFEYYLICKK